MASNYQPGYDDERFESMVNRNFHCLICYNVLKDPVMCRKNQHYFCRGCITEHLRRNTETCPTCADGLSVETLQDVPRIVMDYLNELSIRCDHYDRGCQELVQLQHLKGHVDECGFTPVVCGNQGCGETISKRDRTYHESELCQFRKLKCHNCEEISTTMAGMETRIASMSAKMAIVKTKLTKTNTEMENISTGITNVKMKLTSTTTKLKSMETKMASMSTEMAYVKTKLTNTNTEMANISTDMAIVKTELTSTNRKLRTMDTKMANINTEMENMTGKMAHTDMKLENVDTKVANLQVNMEAKFKVMNHEVRKIKMCLNEVKDGFDQLKEAVLENIENEEKKQEEITSDVSGTASGGKEHQYILAAGGYGEKSVEIFNCRQRLWCLLKSMPVERYIASSFIYNNHVTVAGGWCPGPGAVDNMIQMNIHLIDELSIKWSIFGAKLPVELYAHSSVLYKDSLFVTGGYDEDDVVSDCIYEVQLKQPYAVKLVSRMFKPRIRHSTVLCDDSILILGGKKSTGYKDNLSSVLSYDIKKNECQQLPALPYPVSEMATVKWAENVVIIGGVDKDGKALNNVIIYNIKTGNSHMLPPMLHKRKGCMAVVVENTIVVLGGMNETRNTLKSVESFSFDNYAWEKLPEMKEPRWLATAVVI